MRTKLFPSRTVHRRQEHRMKMQQTDAAMLVIDGFTAGPTGPHSHVTK